MNQLRGTKFSSIGLALGAAALLISIVHFWIAASVPSAPLEERIADKAVAIRDTTFARLSGKSAPAQPAEDSFNTDRIVIVATSTLGGLAFVLSIFGFSRQEPRRACVGAAILGISTVLFPFVIGAIGAVLVLFAVAALLSMFFG